MKKLLANKDLLMASIVLISTLVIAVLAISSSVNVTPLVCLFAFVLFLGGYLGGKYF